jgi:hypothetical protein
VVARRELNRDYAVFEFILLVAGGLFLRRYLDGTRGQKRSQKCAKTSPLFKKVRGSRGPKVALALDADWMRRSV